jgi:manganese efflux pump family protein
MGFLSLAFVALALAMDAFAVAVAAGLSPLPLTRRRLFRLSFHFGLFQALMPLLGWLAGTAVYRYIAAFDHWVAFGLLALVGGRMVVGALGATDDSRPAGDATKGWQLVMLSVATSIDALAVGLSLAMMQSPIFVPALVIGIVAAALTAFGMRLGKRLGRGWGQGVEVAGGLVLIALGLKILAQHIW